MKGKGELISIVVPMYDNEDVVLNTAKKLTKLKNKYNLELIFVDDGSSDNTLKIMKDYAKEHKCISIYENKRNLGKGGAIKNGVSHSHGKIVLFTDADLAYDIKQVEEMLKFHQKNNTEVTIGSRILHKEGYSGYSPIRKIASRIFRLVTKHYIKIDVTDTQAGLKCFDGKVAREIFRKLETSDFAFDIELLLIAKNSGYRISEMPVKIVENDNSGSSINVVRDSVKMLKDLHFFRKKYCKNIVNKKLLLFSFLVTMVFFGTYMRLSFATDTYADIYMTTGETVRLFLSSGRFITALFLGGMKFLGFSIEATYLAMFLLSIASITFAIYILSKLYRRLVKDESLSFLLAVMTIISPFIIELFHFLEKGTMTLGILLVVLAVKAFVEFLETDKKSYILKSFLLYFVATGCYQGVLGLFLILAMVFIIEKCKKLKKVAVAILWTGAIYGVGTLLNILLSKTLWNSSRVLGGGDLIGTIESFGNNFSEVFINYCHMVPAWAPILAIGCIAMIALLYCAKDKMIKKFIFALFKSMLVIIVSIIAAATPQIVNMNGFAPEPRLLYPYGAIIGGVGLLIVNPVRLGRWGRVLIVSVIVFFLGIELYSFNGLEISNYIKDAVDADRSRIIQDHINSYEKLSNIVVTRISPIKDSVPTYAYPETHFYGDINITSFATSWSDVASINYYNQKGYIRVNADNQEMNNYCKGKNWDAFSEEQMIFDSNTLYLCLY